LLTSCPSRETWMCPWSVGMAPLTVVWVAGTTLPPITLTTRVTSGPVVWFGVGCTIWMRTGDAGCCVVDDEVDFAPPQPVAVTATASTRGRARRVSLALRVDTFFQGRNNSTATTRETPIVLTASAFVQ